MKHLIRQLRRWIEPLQRRVFLMVSRGVIRRVSDDQPIQNINAEFYIGDIRSRIQRIQEFGFSSHPPEGSECVGLAVAGDRSNMVVLGTENRQYRINELESGEVVIYDQTGSFIRLQNNGDIHILADEEGTVKIEGNVQIEGDVSVSGDLSVNGDISADGDVSDGVGSMQQIRTVYNSHVHVDGTGSPDAGESPTPTM